MTTVRDNQADQLALLQQILLALQAQPNPLPQLALIAAQLEAVNAGVGLLLASLQRIEQFIAPTGQAAPTGATAGMAFELARLARQFGGPGNAQPATTYTGLEALNVLAEEGLIAWNTTSAANQRLVSAVWPNGQDRPNDTLGGPNSIFWYLYRLAHATTAPFEDATPRQPLQVALDTLLDLTGDIASYTAPLPVALGGRVANKSAIEWLAAIADCSCGGELPPPSPGGCIAPEVSVGAVSTGARLYASWGGAGQIFFVGAVEFEAQPGSYPLGVGLISNIWTELSIYVASSAPYWFASGDEVGEAFPANTWLPVPRGSGETLGVNVPAGHTLTAYLCAADAQPDPQPGWSVLNSAGGAILNEHGVPAEPYSYGYAINEWGKISLESRRTNTQSGYTHEMDPGSYVDLPQTYTIYSDQEFGVYRGSEGFVTTVEANQQYEIGPGTNWSIAKPGAPFSIYIRPGPISP